VRATSSFIGAQTGGFLGRSHSRPSALRFHRLLCLVWAQEAVSLNLTAPTSGAGQAPRAWSIKVLGFEVLIRRSRAPGESEPLATDNQLEKLHATYRLLKDTFPTWPIPVHFARNLCVVSVLPLMTGIVGLIAKF
jgi:hypothetical protein